eukprot:g9080.t1
MVKSSQQCRTRKGPRQGGGLVVVNQRHLSREAPGPPPKPTKGKKKKKNGALTLGELMASGNDSEDFDTSPPTPPPPGGVAKYVFSSTHHTLEQRLYYLLATRPSQPKHLAGVHHHHHHQPGGGGSVDGSSAAAAAAVEGGCHAVVFVENTAVAQELIGMLKALSLTAYAVHDRTPKAQAQEHIKRFLAAPSAERSSVLVLTNAALARSPPSVGPVKPAHGPFLRIVHFDAPEGEKNAAARGRVAKSFSRGRGARTVEEVYLGGEGRDTVALAPFSFDGAGMGFIRSRLIVAKKLSKAVALSAGEGEDRGMQRAATAAGLEWDGDAGQSDTGAAAAKREKRRAHAQQAAALRQKVSVLLCQPLLPQPSSAATSTTTASSKTAVQQSSKELRKKMAVLGMIHGPQGGAAGTPLDDAAGAGGKDKGGAGAGAPEERAAAQTRWLDGCNGEVFGGAWAGSVRRGASCDCTSREVRARVEAAKRAGRGGGGSGGGGGKGGAGLDATTAALAKWNPNPDTPDPERWGGRWGKPCGHNEVVLQHLRPFAPMEVVNTRVCSRTSPAPGNAGFDGCLELLSLTCRAHERALTVWDETSFVHIDGAGACSSLPKQSMLRLSLPTLRFLMKNMRGFTVCGGGREPPREVARAVILSAGWGAKQSKFGPLSAELSRRVLSFVLSGDVATWRAIATGLGLRGIARQGGGPASGQASQEKETLAFASKKKRKNFNL